MNAATAANPNKPRLGYRFCATCGNEVHHKSVACKGCGTPNLQMADVLPSDKLADFAAGTPHGDLDEAFGPALPKPAPSEVVPLPTAAVVVEPYIVLQDFRTLLGDVIGVFKKGMILNDFALIATLREAGNPIAPSSQASGLSCCPKCQHVFPLMATAPGRKPAG